MRTPQWLLVLGTTLASCGARVSVGDLGNGDLVDPGSATSSAAGPTTSGSGSDTVGSAASSTGAGGAPIGGAGGSAGGPSQRDAGRDGPLFSPIDANVPVDVGRLGGAACGGIEYPPTAFYGENFLPPDYAFISPGKQIELAAKLAPNASLRIRMWLLSGSVWFYGGQGTNDFRVTLFDFATGMQLFEAADSGRMVEQTFQFPGSGRALVEYFECGATTPTGTKFISWGGGT